MAPPRYVSDALSAAPYASRDRADLDPVVLVRFERLEAKWGKKYRFRKLKVTCTYRNCAEQLRLWRIGRTMPGRRVTNIDGFTKKGKHNFWPALALDVCVELFPGEPKIVKPTISWNEVLYYPLMVLAADEGLVSGGSWKKPDWPHIEKGAV